jgi:hypothetical protein
MLIRLTKHEIGWFRLGSDPETGTIFLYRIEGLPGGEQASIGEFPYRGWRILRWKDGLPGVWHGEHETADQAMAALQNEVEYELTLAAGVAESSYCNRTQSWLPTIFRS